MLVPERWTHPRSKLVGARAERFAPGCGGAMRLAPCGGVGWSAMGASRSRCCAARFGGSERLLLGWCHWRTPFPRFLRIPLVVKARHPVERATQRGPHQDSEQPLRRRWCGRRRRGLGATTTPRWSELPAPSSRSRGTLLLEFGVRVHPWQSRRFLWRPAPPAARDGSWQPF